MEVLRLHYRCTVKHWRERFAKNRAQAAAICDERFCRMWEFYLAAVELEFLHGSHMVFQLLLSTKRDAVTDSSVDLYFGPTAPAGKESNWIKTLPGRGWWVWFRFYGPTEAFFDKSWRLPDFETV